MKKKVEIIESDDENEKEANDNAKSTSELQQEILDLNEEEKLLELCAVCKKEPEVGQVLKRCTACFSVAYCSKKCQVKDWKRHKEECDELKKINEQRVAEMDDFD